MIIDKLSDSSYKLSDIEKIDIFANFFQLFNIKTTTHASSIILYNIKSIQHFNDWKKTLPHPYIDYQKSMDLFNKLASMFLYLEKHNFQFSSLDEDKLIVINDDIIIPINMNDVYKINKENISINTPYDKNNRYLPFYLREMNSLPISTSYKTCYTSLALLIIDLFIGINKNDTIETLLDKIHVIYNTRVYWLLCNLLKKNKSERILINI